VLLRANMLHWRSQWFRERHVMNCRLCGSPGCLPVYRDALREYRHCTVCDLIFVPVSQFVTIEEERARYELHDNTGDNAGYRSFLGGVAEIVAQVTAQSGRILDFGSGRHAVLTALLRERGYSCTACDPLYGIGMDFAEFTYNTVVLCETIEHLRDLKEDVRVITRLVNPSGTLVIRTGLHPQPGSFGSWWYKNDPTHINYLGMPTIEWIAKAFGYAVVDSRKNGILLLNRSGISSITSG
jgi:hypothetical protein